jgi:hypothetical protein
LWIQARKDGFVGSGTTLRRIAAPIVHVVNIEGSRENLCYVNLGAHLCFLPSESGNVIDPSHVLEYHCAFRKRIEPPPGSAFGWAYLDDPREAAESIAFVLGEWNRVGRPFFAAHGNYPDSFERMLDAANVETAHPIELLTFARIAAHLRRLESARKFASIGLARSPERATGLIRSLRLIVEHVGAAEPALGD